MNDIDKHTQADICLHDAGHQCLTCSDAVCSGRVMHVDREAGLALVEINHQTEEIDITLVEEIGLGDLLLTHGGVAIARLEELSQ